MNRLLILLAALLILSGCAAQPATDPTVSTPPSKVTVETPVPDPTGKKPGSKEAVYTSANYGFSVTYDSSVFVLIDTESEGAWHGVFTVKKHPGADVYLYAATDEHVCERLGQPNGPVDLKTVLDAATLTFGTEVSCGAIEPVVLNGASGWRTHGVAGGTRAFDAYAVGNGHYAYMILPRAQAEEWKTLEPTMNRLVNSFTILK
jgi:hypothetical protein